MRMRMRATYFNVLYMVTHTRQINHPVLLWNLNQLNCLTTISRLRASIHDIKQQPCYTEQASLHASRLLETTTTRRCSPAQLRPHPGTTLPDMKSLFRPVRTDSLCFSMTQNQ
ncbi:uncharacterized protein LOC143450846 [Clavelina lepadiformis]|uniref:uncharacterized protein LOC143450846 n=1 Tax=Clavelina lepadiformis TaxID=159417 RepID=UPI0040438AF5